MAAMDYAPLGKAIQRLKEALRALEKEPGNDLYRDAVIQRFEFTYGLCASYMARYLALASAVPLESKMSFPTLVRTAAEAGLLRSGWERWYQFREARNLTSHTYDEDKAKAVLAQIPDFADEAEYLSVQLNRRSEDHGD
ncbi:MAG: HI0074 family nucleotidyltransferase substrate-binding subunit [Acidobacteriota bacterium]